MSSDRSQSGEVTTFMLPSDIVGSIDQYLAINGGLPHPFRRVVLAQATRLDLRPTEKDVER